MKICLLFILLVTTVCSNAQIKKGALFLGGDLQVYGSEYKTIDSNQYTRHINNYYFSPVAGWVSSDNFIIGGRLFVSFSNDNEEHPDQYSSKGHNIGAGIWMRRYLPLHKSFFLFVDASLNAQSVYLKQVSGIQTVSSTQKGFAIGTGVFPGISYQVKKSLFIEAALNNLLSLQYERAHTEVKRPADLTRGIISNYSLSSSLGSGVPLQIGIRWIIPKKTA